VSIDSNLFLYLFPLLFFCRIRDPRWKKKPDPESGKTSRFRNTAIAVRLKMEYICGDTVPLSEGVYHVCNEIFPLGGGGISANGQKKVPNVKVTGKKLEDKGKIEDKKVNAKGAKLKARRVCKELTLSDRHVSRLTSYFADF
jgi:hypothetical protein